MRISNILLTTAAALLCVASVPANAASLHTWVSSTGSDSNTGARNSPYADFATAVANTTAGGIVSVVDPGDYGPVTIQQSITIDGGNMGSIGFAGAGEGIFVNLSSAGTVVLRNLTVDGQGTGTDAIFVEGAGNFVIDNCRLEGFTQIGIGVGSTAAENVVVRNTTISGGSLGVRTFQSSGLVPFDQVSLDHVTIQGATSAAVFSRNGVLEISNSVLTQSDVAVQVDTSATISVESSMLTMNTTAVCSYTTGTIRLSNNDIFDNGTGIEACGGTTATNGNNRKGGNPGTGGAVGIPNANVNVQ